MTAIVIPITDVKPEGRDQLDNLLKSIEIGGTSANTQVLACFDGCKLVFVDYFKDKYPFITSIINNGNRSGYCKNSNRGLRFGLNELKDSCILTNQDLIMPSWDKLKLLAEGKGLRSSQTLELTGTVEEIQAELDVRYEPTVTSVMEESVPGNKFAGYGYFIHKDVMEECGYVYEPMIASFDEDDLIARAAIAGFPIEISGVRCYHIGSHIDQAKTGESITGAYTTNMVGLNQIIFRERWKIPFNIPHESYQKWIRETYKDRWQELKPYLYCN
jgi:hypothetical protein